MFSRTAARVTLFNQRCRFARFIGDSSADIALNMIKSLFEVLLLLLLLLFIYSPFIGIRVYEANAFERRL